jgi:hypothetical protein
VRVCERERKKSVLESDNVMCVNEYMCVCEREREREWEREREEPARTVVPVISWNRFL